jgi:hypothetical protein
VVINTAFVPGAGLVSRLRPLTMDQTPVHRAPRYLQARTDQLDYPGVNAAWAGF